MPFVIGGVVVKNAYIIKYTPKKLHYKNKIYSFVSNNVVSVFRMKPIAITIYYSLIGKHGQTDPVRTVQIDPFKTA